MAIGEIVSIFSSKIPARRKTAKRLGTSLWRIIFALLTRSKEVFCSVFGKDEEPSNI